MPLWLLNGLLALVVAIVGFEAKREIARNDNQEERIRAVERVCVEVKGVQRDITEMKADIKTLLLRTP
jgi:hypothetical protein